MTASRTIIRFKHDPRHHEVPARLSDGRGDPGTAPDTVLGHLNNVIAGQMLAGELAKAAPGGQVLISARQLFQAAARLRAVECALREAFEAQEYLDTSARADNLPF